MPPLPGQSAFVLFLSNDPMKERLALFSAHLLTKTRIKEGRTAGSRGREEDVPAEFS